jgi:peptide chain release factor subunit 3
LAYILDSCEEERKRGITIEVGKAFFETETKTFTILDAPGHSGFIPNMIQGACQADYAGLVISAKTGEFEAGFEFGGNTREHIILARSLGVSKVVCIVNKMDDVTVKWNHIRFEKIKDEMSPFLRRLGFKDIDVFWIPVSALHGDNLTVPVSQAKCPWYKGPPLLEILDKLKLPERNENGPVRFPIIDKYKDVGIKLVGRLESGIIRTSESYILMPSRQLIEINSIAHLDYMECDYAITGEHIVLSTKDLDDEYTTRGQVVCSIDNLCPIFAVFEAEIFIVGISNKVLSTGYQCILHLHTIITECMVTVVSQIDHKEGGEKRVKFVLPNNYAKVRISTYGPICGEKYENLPSMGRFVLREDDVTIAIGKIVRYKPWKEN